MFIIHSPLPFLSSPNIQPSFVFDLVQPKTLYLGPNLVFLASWDAIEQQGVSHWLTLMNQLDWCDPGEWRYRLKPLLMRLWRLMILREIMLKVVNGVLVIEVYKVADEVANMEVDKVADMKIHIENLFCILSWFLCQILSIFCIIKGVYNSSSWFYPDIWGSYQVGLLSVGPVGPWGGRALILNISKDTKKLTRLDVRKGTAIYYLRQSLGSQCTSLLAQTTQLVNLSRGSWDRDRGKVFEKKVVQYWRHGDTLADR